MSCICIDNNNNPSSKGGAFHGAIYLPDGVIWMLTCKKVKSYNTSSIHGRVAVLNFPRNTTGVLTMQVTMIRNKPESMRAKDAALAFEQALQQAKRIASS